MSLFRGPRKEKFNLGIAIGTGSVNAILYGVSTEGKPTIYKTVLREHSVLPQSDFSSLEHYVKNEVQEIKKAIQPDLKGTHLENVNVLLSSPWYFSQTRIVNIRRTEAFMAENTFLKENLSEERERFMKNAREQFSLPAERYSIIEMAFMKILMNGYEVNNFYHKEAHELTLDMYMSLSFKDFIDRLNHALETYFAPHNEIVFHTSPFVFFRMLKQLWTHEENKIVFDIDAGIVAVEVGGEITDVTIIRKGIVEETFSFGKGLHFIIRRLASAFGVAPKNATSLFRSWQRGDMEEKQKVLVGSIVGDGVNEWKLLLEKVLSEAASISLLPGVLHVFGEGASFPGFANVFTDKKFQEFILQNKPFEVKVFTPAFFRPFFEGPAPSFAGGTGASLLYMLALPVEFNRIE